jgi:pSer/pThr/pTyr-binding forkhead associated (FHA) protein
MAKLVISVHGTQIRQCVLDSPRVSIGRDRSNAIAFDDPALARVHALIIAFGQDHIVEDAGSEAGTTINGRRVSRHILQHDDVVGCGPLELRYQNPRATSGLDLDRTIFIPSFRQREATGDVGAIEAERLPAANIAKPRLPCGRVHIADGDGQGQRIDLRRVVALFGQPGRQTVVIARRPQGYFVSHVEGRGRGRLNGRKLDDDPALLRDGDVIEVAGQRLRFELEAEAPPPE